ncbi:sigma-54-dependent transcriptional regulator [Granulosicoccus sp. 3-233]|uniref:sigma-54-dependent transcriptional regulator n=1 Tax=Granulosicoccus sp. 3-233 TaxID=3417969 RepID=UPI003D335B77
MPSRPTSLVLEDDVTLARAYERVLVSLGYEVTIAHRVDAARAQIRDKGPELMLIDIDLPDGNGLDLMEELRNDTRGRFIVISGDNSQRAAIKSIRSQAVELLIKPVDLASLRAMLDPHQASEHAMSKEERSSSGSAERAADENGVANLDRSAGLMGVAVAKSGWFQVGDHHALSTLRTTMSFSAERSRGHALITGEPGVDKPSVARAIHQRGRRTGQCLVIDCADETGELAMVRMFGREDPRSGEILHRGYIEQAAAGTLVLDHVEKLPMDMQSRLLPFLESGSFRRVDGNRGAEATLSVIGIARDSGTTDVDETSLRSDFLFRLAQTTLAVPNLRQCRDDIQAIADWLLAEAAGAREGELRFSASSRELIANAVWKRNVRELRSVIEQAVAATGSGEEVQIESDQTDAASAESGSEIEQWVGTTIWEFERQLLNATLLHFDGDKEKTAKTLGVSLKTLYNRMNAY